jgi:hypothetical protein
VRPAASIEAAMRPVPLTAPFMVTGMPTTIDLHSARELDIWEKTVQEYEGLVRQIFPLLGAQLIV